METLVIDTRQQKGKHTAKHSLFLGAGLNIVEKKLYAGDYMLIGTNLSIDTKEHLQELNKDVRSSDHSRFKREVVRAQEAGIKLVILTETEHVASLDELGKWREPNSEYCRRGGSPRLEAWCKKNKKPMPKGKPRRIYGSQLAKSCRTMEKKYGCEFLFCSPKFAGELILDMLMTTPADEKMTFEFITQPVPRGEKPRGKK